MAYKRVMTEADLDEALALKNEILDLCLERKVSTLVALSASRSAAECFEQIIKGSGGEVFIVTERTPLDELRKGGE